MLPGLSSFALRHQRQTGQLLFCVQRYGILGTDYTDYTDYFSFVGENFNLLCQYYKRERVRQS